MNLTTLRVTLEHQLAHLGLDPGQVAAERNIFFRHFLNIGLEQLYLPSAEVELDAEKLERLLNALTLRVEKRLPLQYLIEEADFYGLTFHVTPAVLIPRPETELLVETVLAFATLTQAQTLLDLGTGSGCIAIALKKHCPALSIVAVDISSAALAVAQENARQHQADIRFCLGSWFEPLEGELFDIIVSNPPYIATDEWETLMPEVLHEPSNALFAQEGVERLYRQLLAGCQKHLRSSGGFFFEIGHQQGPLLQALAESMGFQAQILKDYSENDRFLTGNFA